MLFKKKLILQNACLFVVVSKISQLNVSRFYKCFNLVKSFEMFAVEIPCTDMCAITPYCKIFIPMSQLKCFLIKSGCHLFLGIRLWLDMYVITYILLVWSSWVVLFFFDNYKYLTRIRNIIVYINYNQ